MEPVGATRNLLIVLVITAMYVVEVDSVDVSMGVEISDYSIQRGVAT
jgi:hypothetical protein